MKLGRSIRVIFILAILITGGFVFWLFNALHSPVSHRSANRYIVIEQGSTSNGILEVLGEHDIIQVPLATRGDNLALETGRTKREIVIIASLIENESKIDSERNLVASVIYNRLEQGIPLGIDATNVYIAKLLGRWDGIIHKSDVEVDHPYNTRRILGLPPGPISSLSRTAIKAALHPAQTDNLYYVLNVQANDGSHYFYSSATEFAKGKADYQRWLAGQRDN